MDNFISLTWLIDDKKILFITPIKYQFKIQFGIIIDLQCYLFKIWVFTFKRIKVTNVQPPFDVYYDELF